MNKKNFLINILLVCILSVIVVIGVILFKKYDEQRKQEEANNVKLTEIGYGSEISPVGNTNASGIINSFVSAYNDSNGKALVSIMNLVATYIYSEYGEAEFDNKYVEILSNPREYDELLIMQQSLQQEESALIQGMEENSVNLTLIENSEIEDTSKYLSKMTAKVRTVSEKDGIDENDTLEFILLHRDDVYYIINYNMVAE